MTTHEPTNEQNDAIKSVALRLADQCARHCQEKANEFTEEEITEMFFDHLLRQIAHEVWSKM